MAYQIKWLKVFFSIISLYDGKCLNYNDDGLYMQEWKSKK